MIRCELRVAPVPRKTGLPWVASRARSNVAQSMADGVAGSRSHLLKRGKGETTGGRGGAATCPGPARRSSALICRWRSGEGEGGRPFQLPASQ
eukprot:8533877-Pyramimonas_sp.AAC.1